MSWFFIYMYLMRIRRDILDYHENNVVMKESKISFTLYKISVSISFSWFYGEIWSWHVLDGIREIHPFKLDVYTLALQVY